MLLLGDSTNAPVSNDVDDPAAADSITQSTVDDIREKLISCGLLDLDGKDVVSHSSIDKTATNISKEDPKPSDKINLDDDIGALKSALATLLPKVSRLIAEEDRALAKANVQEPTPSLSQAVPHQRKLTESVAPATESTVSKATSKLEKQVKALKVPMFLFFFAL